MLKPTRRLILFGIFCALTSPAVSQEKVPLPQEPQSKPAAEAQPPAPSSPVAAREDVSSKALEDLVATIEDPERRARLLAELKTLLAVRSQREAATKEEEQEGLIGGLVSFFGELSGQMRETAIQLLEQVSKLPERWRVLWRRLYEPEARKSFLFGAAAVGGIVFGAAFTAILAWRLLRRPRSGLGQGPPVGALPVLSRLWRLLALAALNLIPPAVLIGASLATLTVVGPPAEAKTITLAILWAIVFKQIVGVSIELVLASRAPRLRLLPMGDERASALSASLNRLASLGVYGYFLIWALKNLGTEDALLTPLRSVYGLVLLAGGVVLVLKERGHVREQLASLSTGAETAPRPAGASSWRSVLVTVLGLWWLGAIIYMVGLYMVWASGAQGGFILSATAKTLLAIALASLFISLTRRFSGALQVKTGWLLSPYPEMAARVPQYSRGFNLVLDSAAVFLAACLCLEAWGVSALEALGSDAAQNILSGVVGILIVILLAAATIDIATVFSQRYIEARERTGKASAKVRTLVPLARQAIRAVVIIIAAIMILSNAGVNTGPILAGMGVLGLAIGFGAQTLVKDIITGVFMLLEDSIAVGDEVDLNNTKGQVEAINIRTIRLRDGNGSIHTIPYSSVTTITNMSRDFSRWMIEAAVAYREDVDRVLETLKEIGEGLRRDPEFGRDILEPIEIFGLERFDESAVVIRARLTTRPGQQWRIGREFNRRMKKVFDERGIEIPFPRTVHIAGLADLASHLPPRQEAQAPALT